MEIDKLVNKTIEKRHGKLPWLESESEMLDALTSALEKLDDFKNEIVDAEGNPVDGKNNAIICWYPDFVDNLNAFSTETCRKSISNARSKVEAARRRFERDSLNISVIGEAKTGKTRFIQSVSNLSEDILPDYYKTDYTGTVFTVHNRPGTESEAHITFNSEDEMVETVQTYLDRLLSDLNKRMVVRTLDDIRDLNLTEVENAMDDGNPDNILLNHLKNFVLNFEEWASCVKEKEVVLSVPNVIQSYLTMNNRKSRVDPEREEYYKYLAIKSVDFYCTFDYKEAGKITFIDTIGFGYNIGTQEEIARFVNEKSDAVIFMLFPFNLAGGISKEIANVYKRITTDYNNKNLDKWLFWLINYAPNHGRIPNNMNICKASLETLENNKWQGAIRKIIDVSDQTQVREEFLIPLLNNLLDNLDDIDNLYLQDVQEALEDVKKEYLNLFNRLKSFNEICALPLMQQYYRYFDDTL